MRRAIVVPAVIVGVAVAIYVAGPLVAGYQLRQAVLTRDQAALERHVDWPLLRANITPRLVEAIAENASASGSISGAIKRTLGKVVTGPAVNTFVTPGSLARILAGRAFVLQRLPGKSADAKQPPPPDTDDEDVDDPMPPRRLRWAFFESPTRFRVEATNPRLPHARIASILALEGWRWKLVDVDIVKR